MQNTDNFILSRPIAHRGFWNNSDAPENSLKSFENAIKANYIIELDVHVLKCGTIVVFHDYTLSRMTGVDGNIEQMTYDEIKNLKLLNSNQHIPTLKQTFDLVAGKVPILLEFKSEKLNAGQDEEVIYNQIKNYNGQVAFQSFNPISLKWFKNNAPQILRGMLSSHFPKNDKNRPKSFLKRFVVKYLLLKKSVKPNFIGYNSDALPSKRLQRMRKKYPLIVWTVNSQQEYSKIKNQVDNIIFQNFIPD